MVVNSKHKIATVRKLPYDAEIEFLESTGTQIMYTGVYGNNDNLAFDIKFKTLTFRAYTGIFGNYVSEQANCWRILPSDTNTGVHYICANTKPAASASVNLPINNDYIVHLDKNYYSVNGVNYNSPTTKGSTSNTEIVFFAQRIDANNNYKAIMRLYYFKIYNGQTILRDFIPVRFTNSQGQTEGAMYDKVSGELFTNKGSGSFVLGDDVVPYDAEVEFLESDGGQYIDTGVAPKDIESLYIRFMPLSSGALQYGTIIGARSGSSDNGSLQIRCGTSSKIIHIGTSSGGNMSGYNMPFVFNSWNTVQLYANNREVIANDSNIMLPAVAAMTVDLGLTVPGLKTSATSITMIAPCRISNITTKANNFIPVRKGSVGYMYDRANPKGGPLGNGLYPNSGSGNFILGDDVAYPNRKFEVSFRKPFVIWPQPTARDYIQDGLIELWDGIENAGWGVHDDNATEWANLVTPGNPLTLQNGAHFDSTSLITANRNLVTALLPFQIGYASIEVCAFRDSSRNSSALVCFGNDADNRRMLTIEPDGGQIYNGTQIYGVASNIYKGTWAATYMPTPILYINGATTSGGNTRTNNWGKTNGTFGLSGSSNYASWNFVGNYYCVRLYSRALTSDEIAHNYAIDKARFGLP